MEVQPLSDETSLPPGDSGKPKKPPPLPKNPDVIEPESGHVEELIGNYGVRFDKIAIRCRWCGRKNHFVDHETVCVICLAKEHSDKPDVAVVDVEIDIHEEPLTDEMVAEGLSALKQAQDAEGYRIVNDSREGELTLRELIFGQNLLPTPSDAHKWPFVSPYSE